MKTKTFLSALTSIIMTGTMVLSAMPFAASAASNPVALAMTSDKTEFTLEEVESGKASTTIYVDVTSEFSESAEVSFIEFQLRPGEWGTLDPKNLLISDPNVVGTSKGNNARHFECNTTSVISEWENKECPALDVDYKLYNFLDSGDAYTGPCDEFSAKLSIMTSSQLGFIRTGGAKAGEHLAQFEVFLPDDLEAGEYTVNFYKPEAGVGNIIEGTLDILSISDAEGITIKVGDEGDIGGEDDDILLGDANVDGVVNVRDCAFIATNLANRTIDSLPEKNKKNADYNQDGKINVRDAALLAQDIASGKFKK